MYLLLTSVCNFSNFDAELEHRQPVPSIYNMPWVNLGRLGHSLVSFPAPIVPLAPDFINCDARYGQFLKTKDCRLATIAMPRSREGEEVDWAVNHIGRDHHFNLPLTFRHGECAVTIEAQGPNTYYEIGHINPPFTIKASPFQLRGLAAYVIKSCVNRPSRAGEDASIGGFATDRMENLAEYLLDENIDLSAPLPPSTTFITVTVGNVEGKNRSPGNFDPSIAVLVAEYLANRARGQPSNVRGRLNGIIHDFTLRTQKMYAGGKTTPFWSRVATSEEQMSYQCDPALGAPAKVDCAHVEFNELGANDDTFSIGPGISKVLSSNTCHLTISAAITTVLYWRQVRIALDTLLNVCLAVPFGRPAGGRAFVGARHGVSGGIWGRDTSNVSIDAWTNGTITGLDALPPGANITLSTQPLTS